MEILNVLVPAAGIIFLIGWNLQKFGKRTAIVRVGRVLCFGVRFASAQEDWAVAYDYVRGLTVVGDPPKWIDNLFDFDSGCDRMMNRKISALYAEYAKGIYRLGVKFDQEKSERVLVKKRDELLEGSRNNENGIANAMERAAIQILSEDNP